MKTIWKFPLKITDRQEIAVPLPATALTVQIQDDQACLWAEVDPEGEKVMLEIAVIGTGNRLPDGVRYISTILLGSLVWHFYEVL